ncbi:MAG TPA: NADH-quinone oxidoreductase subunit M [Dehalococcoidia bacterium]|nr:NADH-quinone oxidoreductase subunit M [Dehalococcoidia bacterium]
MTSFVVFFPLLGALVVALTPSSAPIRPRVTAAVTTFVVFVATVVMFVLFDRDDGGFQFEQEFTWIDADNFEIKYLMGVDGISVTLLLLTGLLTFIAVLISWGIETRAREYFVWLLVLETGVLGVFTSLDLVLFFLFWEVELIPMYLLISIWGTGRKEYSAIKFLAYTLFGSGFMLAAILALGFSQGTFDYTELSQMTIADTEIPVELIFFGFFAAFAIKLPVFPVHTWLPDAHTDAPTAVSVMLAGVLLKMGGYGIIRFCIGLMPDVARDWDVLLAALAATSVVYGALVTLRQTDLKRLIAYSSVSHMGFVLLGVAALGSTSLSGATLQMFTHGTITGLLFLMVGVIYDRTHTRQIPEMRGLASRMPVAALVTLIAGFASLGLPALSGFAAELTVFLGSFGRHEAATIAVATGVVLAAGYILWTIERVFHGPVDEERWGHLTDADQWWERVPMAALVVAIVVVGVYPAVLTDVIEMGIEPIAGRL